MKHNITDVLDKCIGELRRGKTQAECLATYADAAPTLLPLVQTAVALRQAPKAQASPAAMSTGKAAFLQEAARLRQAQFQRPAKPWQRLAIIANATFALPRPRALAWTPALSVLLALVLVFGTATTAIAAGRSLPDEPLYPVKLASEQVQAALTTDPVARADLALELAEKRLDEITTLTTLGRPVSAPSINRLADGSTDALASISRIDDDSMALRLERYLSLVAQQQALLLQVPSVPTVSDAINAALTVAEQNKTLATTAMTDPSVLKETPPQRTGRAVGATPKDTATPPASPDVRQMRTPVPTHTPAAPATATNTPQPTSTATQPPAPSATPTAAPPTATAAVSATTSPTTAPIVEFSGVIEKITASEWVVGGRAVAINARTKIEGAPASVGATADVKAVAGANQALTALSVTVHALPEQPGTPVSLRGIILGISAASWNIGGQMVTVNAATQIRGAAALGMIAQASGVRQNDAIIATAISVVGPAPTAQLSGKIERISGQTWVIGGQAVLVAPGFTSISGSAEVDKQATVSAVRQDDGSLIARQITILAAVSEEEFEGMINRMDGGTWIVSGRRVIRNQNTTLDETLGPARVGQRVRVRGLLQADGAIVASIIRVLAASGSGHNASPTMPPVTVTRTPVAASPTPPAPVASPTLPPSPIATPTPTATLSERPFKPSPVASPTATVTRQPASPTATPAPPMRTRTPRDDR